MALPNKPSRDAIWTELEGSNYRNGGANLNHLQDMYEYVFGDTTGNYSRNAFGGFGIPVLGTTLTLTPQDNALDCEFTISDDGGFANTYVAEYWDSSQNPSPSTTNYQQIGTGSGTGTKTGTITGLDSSITYTVRVTAYNKFNNSTNYPQFPNTEPFFVFTGTDQASPTQAQLDTPFLSTVEWEDFNANLYLNFGYSDNEDEFDVQFRLNGSTPSQLFINCSSNVGTANTNIEIVAMMTSFPQTGDTVEARVRATSTSKVDSQWSSWVTGNEVATVQKCPL